jgi:hypothetical protein
MQTDVPRVHGGADISPSIPSYFEASLHMLPGVHVPLRSMFVPMRGVLISPVGSEAERAILPQVRVIVAPSLLHHLHVAEARKLTPGAELWGPPGFADKVEGIGPIKVFGQDPWPYDDEIAAEVIEGAPRRNEVVFLHRATRTLYTADLVFNIHRHAGLLAPLTFRAMGIYKRFAVAKMWNHWVKDRAAFDRSIQRVLAWDFDRIVMAHGDIVEAGGRRILIDALRERDLLPR